MVSDSVGSGLSFVVAVFNLGLGVLNWSQIGGVKEVTRVVAHTLAVSQPSPIPIPSPAPCPPDVDHRPVLHEVSAICSWSGTIQICGIGWLTLLVLACWCISRQRPAPRHQWPLDTASQQAELQDIARAQVAAVRSRHHGGGRL